MPSRSSAAIICRNRLGVALLAIGALLIAAGPAGATDFTDAAGRRLTLPATIGRILPADPNAEVLVLVLAPEKLAGLSRVPGRGALFPRSGRLPVLDWRPRSDPASMAATARSLAVNLIIDAAPVTPAQVAFANQVQQASGIPYILVDDSFARMPTMLRSIGALLGAGDRAIDLALFAEHAIAGLRGRLLIRTVETRPHVYFGRGRDGLTAALPGSPAGEAIDEAGAINVAAPLGRGGDITISREQLRQMDPEIIIAEERSFYTDLQRNPAWRGLSAVRKHRVYLEPRYPYGWIEAPSGINRVIGLHWLSALFYPDATQEDVRATACDFYDKFYELKLTNAQLEAMVRPAGIPPAEGPRLAPEPLVGLGAAPASALPPSAPGAPHETHPAATPGAPSTTPSAPSPIAGMPNLPPPTGGPKDACTVPGGPAAFEAPMLTNPGASPLESAPTATPGVPPPGRRGRPGTAPQP